MTCIYVYMIRLYIHVYIHMIHVYDVAKTMVVAATTTTTLRDGVVITCSSVMLQSCSLSRCAFFGVVVSVTMRVGWSCGCSRCHGQRVVARIQ